MWIVSARPNEEASDEFINGIANFEIQPDVQRYPESGTITANYASSAAFPDGAQVSWSIQEAEAGLRQVEDEDGVTLGIKTYIVTSTCQHPKNNTITVTLNQTIALNVMYAFQLAVFYSDDLEILPGPNMNLRPVFLIIWTIVAMILPSRQNEISEFIQTHRVTNFQITIGSFISKIGDYYLRGFNKIYNLTFQQSALIMFIHSLGIYATRNDAGAGEQPGIRLINGSQIYGGGGLTVVSNDPVYIQGDYNTVNKRPTAVIGDSINILSNNWNDSNSTKTLSNRTANNTTVNTAFISGADNTTSGHYNGGLENYPRLHEGWSGKALSIRGSFVEFWNSQVAQGAWQYGGSQYTAPNRNWDYDSDFDVNNMPPFIPWTAEAQRGVWWKS